ncbi:hypothetical protein [Bacillus cereus group sp. BfR-BA-01312]|uniref:hypothetical protein n=1 Tax=Bacillus cereus group sp. BfR-BA-01312 TaxID=2920289 RepID=UPI001F5948F3|nr:hypothetical protein [Bacillus cereus group sp. BfR-BA-01312]
MVEKLYSPTDFADNAEIIKASYAIFTKEINERLRVNDGAVTQVQMNYCIDVALQGLRGEKRRVVDAFYDTYTGMWNMMGREMADEMVIKLLGS